MSVSTALIDLIVSIELCDNQLLDPDMAVRWLEEASCSLQRLSADEQQQFIAEIAGMASREEDERRRELLLRLSTDLGLAD